MSSRVGPHALVTSPRALARVLGVSEATLDSVRASAVSGEGYVQRSVRIRGKKRDLDVPTLEVRDIQRRIAVLLFPLGLQLHDSCTGYTPQRSALHNARPHVGHRWVHKFDIRDFFPSTGSERVREALVRLAVDESISGVLADIVCCRGSLPLGAPTSPLVSNLVLGSVDSALWELAESHGAVFTRYADDLTFSSNAPFDISRDVARIVGLLGYELNTEKTRVVQRGASLRVTGLTVWDEESPRLPKAFKARLKQDLYYLNKYSPEEHYVRRFEEEWGSPDLGVEKMKAHLRGKIRYANGIESAWTRRMMNLYPLAFSRLSYGPVSQSARLAHLRQRLERIKNRPNLGLQTGGEVKVVKARVDRE